MLAIPKEKPPVEHTGPRPRANRVSGCPIQPHPIRLQFLQSTNLYIGNTNSKRGQKRAAGELKQGKATTPRPLSHGQGRKPRTSLQVALEDRQGIIRPRRCKAVLT